MGYVFMWFRQPRPAFRLAIGAALALILTGVAGASWAQRPPAPQPYAYDAGKYPHYRMAVAVDGAAQTLTVEGELSVPTVLTSGGKLVLALTEAVKDPGLEIIGPGGGRTPVILARKDDPNTPAHLRRWTLDVPTAPAGPLRLAFSYRIEPTTSPLYAITAEGSFASGTGTAWYPQVERQDGAVRMPGLGTIRYDAGKDTVIAGGATGAGPVATIDAPRFFDVATGPYRTVSSRGGRARLYLLGPHPGTAEFAQRLEEVIGALETYFGPLPQKRFDLVEMSARVARENGSDGASLDGFMLATGFYFDQPFNAAFFGHEVSHQWWGSLVRRKGASGAYLLDESLAQFGSLVAVEAIDGPHAAELYRRRGHPGYYAEYSGFGFLSRSLAGIDSPLASLPASDGFISRRVANSKGMMVWSMLEDTLGREAFSAFLRGFAREHAYERVTLDDFMSSLRAKAGEKSWFLEHWFDTVGAPQFEFSWRPEQSGARLTITQTAPYFRAVVPIVLTLANGETLTRTIDVAGPATHKDVTTQAAVTAVALDPTYRVIRWTPEYRAEAEAILPYTRGDIAFLNGRNDEARAAFSTARARLAQPDRFGLSARLHRGLGDVARDARDPALAITHYRSALAARPEVPEQLPEIWRGLADACAAAGDEPCALEAKRAGAAAILSLLGKGHAPPAEN